MSKGKLNKVMNTSAPGNASLDQECDEHSTKTPLYFTAMMVIEAVRPKKIIDATCGKSIISNAVAEVASCGELLFYAENKNLCEKFDLVICELNDANIEEKIRYWESHTSNKGVLLADSTNSQLTISSLLNCKHPFRKIRNHALWLIIIGEHEEEKTSALVDTRFFEDPHSSSSQSTLNTRIDTLYSQEIKIKKHNIESQSDEKKYRYPSEELQKTQWLFFVYKRYLENVLRSTESTHNILNETNSKIAMILNSRSWRITAPFRATMRIFHYLQRVYARLKKIFHMGYSYIRNKGVISFGEKIATEILSGGLLQIIRKHCADLHIKPIYNLDVPSQACKSQTLRVLLVAETSLPQCNKYRVQQKYQMIVDAGYDCTIINWWDIIATQNFLQTHNVAIFYRIPALPKVMETISLAKCLGVKTFWEVDDLIFDYAYYTDNSSIEKLSRRVKKSLLEGIPLYRRAMIACGAGIASTPSLAKAMNNAGIAETVVVNNGLDNETLYLAEQISSVPKHGRGVIRIIYGSGTSTHDGDFKVAWPGLISVLRQRKNVILTVMGHLNLPAKLADLQPQIDCLPASDYSSYIKKLATCQINIAPLEDTFFNDAKSNIKYLEAAIVGLPSVCSPAASFKEAIAHGETGFLAQSPEEWEKYLLMLIDDPSLLEKMGKAAKKHVLDVYTPEAILDRQLLPFLKKYDIYKPTKKRILAVNIFFDPRSYGGSTIVLEQLAFRINQRPDIECAVFTTLPCSEVSPYKIIRYRTSAAEVFGLGLPPETNPEFEYENPNSTHAFREVLRSWKPDIVHLHSIQGIGVQITEVCKEENIPYIVTLHDAWWLCARQFMVNLHGYYCNQNIINPDICIKCTPCPSLYLRRQYRLRQVLDDAALLLTPSAYFRSFFIDNNFSPDHIAVNKNGVFSPKKQVLRSLPSKRKLRFGYSSGDTPLKGANLIKKVFNMLPHENYELLVVDNQLNLGSKSIFEENWKIPGTLKIVPAYTQDSIDEFYAGIDILLFPSQCKESFGLSVREALVRNVWVIVTDTGGVVEDIFDKQNGDIIPLDDDGSHLKSRIANFLDAPEKLDNYKNPHLDSIRLFDTQAEELCDYVNLVLAKTPTHKTAIC